MTDLRRALGADLGPRLIGEPTERSRAVSAVCGYFSPRVAGCGCRRRSQTESRASRKRARGHRIPVGPGWPVGLLPRFSADVDLGLKARKHALPRALRLR